MVTRGYGRVMAEVPFLSGALAFRERLEGVRWANRANKICTDVTVKPVVGGTLLCDGRWGCMRA